MRIDSHQHFWLYGHDDYPWMDNEALQALRTDHLPPDLLCHLNNAGLDGSVVVQVRQTLEENRWMLELADAHDHVRGVVGWVDLCADDVDAQLEPYASHPRFCGIRHIVQDEPDDDYMLAPDFQRGIGRLKAHGMTYDVLVFPKQLPAAIGLVQAFPEQPFVLDHIAKPLVKDAIIDPWAEQIRKLASYPNITCKVSGMITEADWVEWKAEDFDRYLDVVLEAFGAGRLMYGSDWPVCNLAGDYERVFSLAERFASKLSDAERANFWGGNAARFYGLD
ncbi:MAG: amidohydrolase family protein [Planctomycetes bacterium]|nr:amidohydrolase family protein [Planctomycetota bacterium]